MVNPSTITIENVLLVKALKHNLLSISKLCDKGHSVSFNILSCIIEHNTSKVLVFKGSTIENVYMLDLDDVLMHGTKCLVSKNKCLSHAYFNLLNKISSKSLVVGFPKMKFSKDKLCDACRMGKQTRVSFKLKKVISTSKIS